MTQKRVANLSDDKRYFKWLFLPSEPAFDRWVMDRLHVHDSDSYGDRTSYWVVIENDKPRYFKVYHNWGWTDDEDPYIDNVFEITEVDKSQLSQSALENTRFVV